MGDAPGRARQTPSPRRVCSVEGAGLGPVSVSAAMAISKPPVVSHAGAIPSATITACTPNTGDGDGRCTRLGLHREDPGICCTERPYAPSEGPN